MMANWQSGTEEIDSPWLEKAILEANLLSFEDTRSSLLTPPSTEKPSVRLSGLEEDRLVTRTAQELKPRRMRVSNACTECKWRRRKVRYSSVSLCLCTAELSQVHR